MLWQVSALAAAAIWLPTNDPLVFWRAPGCREAYRRGVQMLLRRLAPSGDAALLRAGLRCLFTAAPVRRGLSAARSGAAARPAHCRRWLTALPQPPATAAVQEFLGRPLPPSVTLVEVGPRDGLQNEKTNVRSG